ncbi:tyrosine--tRNA ligase [Chryseobacterium flavum]|uniref:Tyrosine--tRNA ligase n=1 Tax=Chryseobacterium flavum TaxID=415851 RepID=A0A3D9CIQ8_9FLAO|nr:tyrosine--tRNA ligase [Chryseobacterium flavum]REC65624.1 tyrosine--tRNA ligase [Chryseobacterium flavum]
MIQILQENVAITLPENGLEEKLEQAGKENRKLIIKLGFDPTAPDLHLGHAVVLKKLRQFQDLGHQIIIVVGSFTARIGDPTGKNKARKPLSAEQVEHNAQTYITQLSKVIDVEKTKILFNSDWLNILNFSEVIQLLSKVTVAQLMHRNDFNKRFTENTPIALHELVYPVLQGFDSVQIACDIEMGGTDQLFNCTMGRQLQEAHQMPAQIVMCMPLLKGLDGKEKMSKSLNNTIGLTDTPNEMFGKVMSIPDSLISEFIDLTTDFTPEEKAKLQSKIEKGTNPMIIKKLVAKNIICQYHNEASAENAEQFFVNQFQNKNFEEKIFDPVLIDSLIHNGGKATLLELCHQLKGDLSKSAVRRLIENGGIQVDNTKVTDPDKDMELRVNTKIRIGKRGFFELI